MNIRYRAPLRLLTIFSLALATTLPAVATDALKPDDIFDLELVSDPRISPDGRTIVYVRHFSDIMTDQRYSNLWLVGFDGSDHRPLSTGHVHDSLPRWSPDGERLAFVSDRDGEAQIYLRWMDTGQTAKLTNLQTAPGGLAWSPDGTTLAFTALAPTAPPSIGSVPTPPKGAEWAKPPVVIDRLVYRFDQMGYLPEGHVHLFVVPAEGGTERQISSGAFHHGRFGLVRSQPVWTPDGKHLLISANRRQDYELEPLDTEIWQFSVEDGRAAALTDRRGPDNAPAISPDGARIAYIGFDDRYQGYQLTHLYVMNRDGSGRKILSKNLDRSASSPRWAPGGDGIYFLYTDEGRTKLAFTTLGGKIRDLTDQVGGGASAYAGGSFSLAAAGRFTITYSDPGVPADVAVGGPEVDNVRLVTAVNEDLLGHKTLGEVEEIWYDSTHDGRRIQGWVIKPPGFDPSRTYPLVLEIHGGPFAAYGPGFDLEKQLMASAGYMVLYTNPRGSTGYGGEFGNLIHHAYPGDDFYDLDSGIDAVIARGHVDADNLFVTGGSGGGVLTSWMIGRSDRFRAAVTIYPVINWYSWVLSADISAFGTKYWFPGLPWDHPEHYEKRSLLSVVKNVKTPTMVLTGEEDYRTPISESEQYYQALKLLGVDAVFVRFPEEPHGTRRRPSHHVQKVSLITGWFDRYRQETAETAPTAR